MLSRTSFHLILAAGPMQSVLLLWAAAAVTTDVGWRQLPDGEMEYIIQIEPHMLEMLQDGKDLISDIPPNVRGAESWRITVGTKELPREGSLGPELRRSLQAPQTLRPPDNVKRVPDFGERPATFVELEEEPASRNPTTAPAPGEQDTTESEKAEPAKPWLPLTLALVALSGSLSGMAFFGWIAWDYRGRYKALLRQMAEGGSVFVAHSEEAS